jgi:hypothetical protein
MSKSCKGLAMELVKCLSESDCVKVRNLLLHLSCLRSSNDDMS